MAVDKQERARKRIGRRLTWPKEVLFALWRHWLIVGIALSLGLAVTATQIITEPLTYEAKATLNILPNEVLQEIRSERERWETVDKGLAFFNSRVHMLQFDSVINAVVEYLKPGNVLAQGKNLEEESYTGVRRFLNAVRRQVADMVANIQRPTFRDYVPQTQMELAIESFKRRSKVVPDPQTNEVQLFVHGNSPEQATKELEQWIKTYKEHLAKVVSDRRDPFILAGLEHYKEEEKAALGTLQRAKEEARKTLRIPEGENPEVSERARELILQRALRLEGYLQSLKGEVATGPVLPGQQGPDVHSQDQTQGKIEELEMELEVSKISHSENSPKVKELKAKIEAMKAIKAGLRPGEQLKDDQNTKKKTEEVSAALAELYRRYEAMGEELEKIKGCEANLRLVTEWRQSFERLGAIRAVSGGQSDRFDAAGSVQVVDPPNAGSQPYDTQPKKRIAKVLLLAMALGVAAAVFIEVVNGKVRFKDDVVAEFGLPVIGVLPRK